MQSADKANQQQWKMIPETNTFFFFLGIRRKSKECEIEFIYTLY